MKFFFIVKLYAQPTYQLTTIEHHCEGAWYSKWGIKAREFIQYSIQSTFCTPRQRQKQTHIYDTHSFLYTQCDVCVDIFGIGLIDHDSNIQFEI